ncbi:MAG: YDG domain-containing protein, partial [Eubacteriales bacterium]
MKATVDDTDDYQGAEATADFTISKREVGIRGLSVPDKVYDRTVSATIDGTPKLNFNKQKGDDVDVESTAASAEFEDADAGEHKTVYVEGYSLTGADADNYILIQPDYLTASIIPVEVGLNWENTEFTYDGDEHSPTATPTGVLDGDECEVTVTGAQIDAGNYTATATELSNPNYKLPENATQAFEIKKASNWTKPVAKHLTYNGTAQQLITPGMAEGGTMQYKPVNANWSEDWSEDIPTRTNAGTYYVSYRVVGDKNHSDVEQPTFPLIATIAQASALDAEITHYMPESNDPVEVSVPIPDVMPGDAGTLTYSTGELKSPENVTVSSFRIGWVNQEDAVRATISGGIEGVTVT